MSSQYRRMGALVASSDTDEVWSELVPKFAKVPLTIYRHRHRIHGWWKQAQVKFGWGKTNIVVLGRSAVGKSVLIERLNGRPGDLEWTAPSLSRTVESAVLKLDQSSMIARAIPGQISRERDVGIHEALSSHDQLEGVVYVADWGYTNIRDESVKHDLIESRGIDTIEKIRSRNLSEEIRDFADVTMRIRESISRSDGPKWLMILVNKADLFMDRIDEAQRYYHPSLESEFTAPLRLLVQQVGMDNLAVDAAPVSSWHEDFDWNGDIARSHLDESASRALFKNMFARISALSAQVRG